MAPPHFYACMHTLPDPPTVSPEGILGLHGDGCLGRFEDLWSSPILPRASVSPAIKYSSVGTWVPVYQLQSDSLGLPCWEHLGAEFPRPGPVSCLLCFGDSNGSKYWSAGNSLAREKRKIYHKFSCALNLLVPDASLLGDRKTSGSVCLPGRA